MQIVVVIKFVALNVDKGNNFVLSNSLDPIREPTALRSPIPGF